MPQKSYRNDTDMNDRMKAFHRLEAAQEEIRQYLPADFDSDKELEEARLVYLTESSRGFH